VWITDDRDSGQSRAEPARACEHAQAPSEGKLPISRLGAAWLRHAARSHNPSSPEDTTLCAVHTTASNMAGARGTLSYSTAVLDGTGAASGGPPFSSPRASCAARRPDPVSADSATAGGPTVAVGSIRLASCPFRAKRVCGRGRRDTRATRRAGPGPARSWDSGLTALRREQQ